jgi:hypothetical protein
MSQAGPGDAGTDRRLQPPHPMAPALYVNYFEVGHNPFEFLMDLGQYHPGHDDGEGRISIHTRIAIAPPYAKMLSDLLTRAVHEHECEHGPIALIGRHANPFDIVLSSLGEFEDRARALRARDPRDLPPAPGDTTPTASPFRKSR